MKKRIYLAMSLMAVSAIMGCGKKSRDIDKNAAVPAAVVKGALIETVKITSIPATMEVVGTVRARTSAVVSTRIPGVISILKVREGDRVKRGQMLAQLDAQENQATAAVASAGIDEARRGLDEAIARKRLTATTFERYQKLFDEQAVSRQEFDIKQTEKEVASQAASRAEARLKQAEEGSRAASTIAAYTRIIAPISGIITSKQADLGATVFPAQPLMTIEAEGSYQLELAVPESITLTVKPGTAVQVTLDALHTAFSATITEIVPSADSTSHTFIAKIALGQKGLKSGMFGRGAISLGTSINGMLVPKKAVFERGAMTSVWVTDKDGVARMRLVKAGKIVGDNIEILSGLSENERIIVGGVERVSEGAKVE
jgi:multidrug efflux system membrane fusion protein